MRGTVFPEELIDLGSKQALLRVLPSGFTLEISIYSPRNGRPYYATTYLKEKNITDLIENIYKAFERYTKLKTSKDEPVIESPYEHISIRVRCLSQDDGVYLFSQIRLGNASDMEKVISQLKYAIQRGNELLIPEQQRHDKIVKQRAQDELMKRIGIAVLMLCIIFILLLALARDVGYGGSSVSLGHAHSKASKTKH